MTEPIVLCKNAGCKEEVTPARAQLGYKTCIFCGSPDPKRTISIPYNKGAYQLISEAGIADIGRK